ncbi:MAG: patatin family protein [Lachnospiraceae bacterium]|nr:patatin family protein [Lachnospiraceae bacterium]
MKVYSRINELPTGRASEKITKGCLVLEGGAFRGLYTQGFLDAMMLNDINLSCVIGVSAGALSGVNYVSGQIGRSGRINLTYRHDSRYVGPKALLHSRSFLDISFLTEDRGILEPFDSYRFFTSKQRFIAVATNCLTGNATCFEKGKSNNIFAGIRASATMPYISPMVNINGTPYLDGGCSCKIPYSWALQNDFEKIVVIRTRDIEYRKPEKFSMAALRRYRKYKAFARKLSRDNFIYNHQCDEIESFHEEGRLLRMAPSKEVTVSRVEGDMEKLGDLYWLGYNDCIDRLEEIKNYLEK